MCASTVSLDLEFRDTEHLRYAYHSFANLINVVHAELQLLERMSGPDAGLRPSIRLCETATWAFKNRETAVEHAQALMEWRSRIEDDLARVQVKPAYESDGEEARDLIRQVIDDADLRIQEMLARHEIPRPALPRDGATIRSQIMGGAGDQSADRVRVTATAAAVPHGLARGVGHLAAALLAIVGGSGEVAVDVSAAPATESAIIRITTGPVLCDLLPPHPPGSIDPSDPERTVQSLIAFVSYLADPSDVMVDPRGAPLLLIQPR